MNKFLKNLAIVVSIISLFSCQGGNMSHKGRLQHTVYFYLDENISQADKQSFEEGLHQLLSIEEVAHYEIGKTADTPSRAVTDHEFDYSILAWFKTMDDYKVYADHPTHLEFIRKYELFWKDVKVYDSEIVGEG